MFWDPVDTIINCCLGFNSNSCLGFNSNSCLGFNSNSCSGFTSNSCLDFNCNSWFGFNCNSCLGFNCISCLGFNVMLFCRYLLIIDCVVEDCSCYLKNNVNFLAACRYNYKMCYVDCRVVPVLMLWYVV